MSEDNVAFLREFKKYYLALEEFDKYDKARLYCCTEAKILHSLLKKQLEKRTDMSGFKIDDKGQDSFCIKVELPEPIGEKKILIKYLFLFHLMRWEIGLWITTYILRQWKQHSLVEMN